MIKHTPGLWSKIQGIDHTAASIRTESGISVATAFGSEFDQTKANARLIAAAPELLAMLKKLVDDCSGDSLGTLKSPRWEFVCEAAALLHKATGESS